MHLRPEDLWCRPDFFVSIVASVSSVKLVLGVTAFENLPTLV